jgi:hypothetical protein
MIYSSESQEIVSTSLSREFRDTALNPRQPYSIRFTASHPNSAPTNPIGIVTLSPIRSDWASLPRDWIISWTQF